MIKDANDLMEAYNDLSKPEQAKFKKRFDELVRFEKSFKTILKSRKLLTEKLNSFK